MKTTFSKPRLLTDVVLETAQELRKHPLETLNLKPWTCHFLNLPLEIRFEIYKFLTPGYATFQRPTSHPLYPLLHVCHTVRDDIIYLFYHSCPGGPTFTFFNTESCLNFLRTSAISIPMITDLTLHIPATATASLEPIFRKLYLSRCALRSLSIHLLQHPDRHVPRERIVTAYMLPRRICISEAGIQKLRSVNRWTPVPTAGEYVRDDFVFADTHSGLAIRQARENSSALGKCGGGLRELRVYGQPKNVSISTLTLCPRDGEEDIVTNVENRDLTLNLRY